MKQLVLLISMLWSLTLTAAVVQPGLRISQYPNRGTPHGSDLFILAVTNTFPSTNMNATLNQISNAIVAGIGPGGDAGGTNSRQGGTLTITNLSSNPNVVTNILGAGTVTVTSNNLGTFTITGAASSVGVGLAPGTTTIVVDGSLNTRTNALIGDSSIIFSNLTTGQPVRGWFFSSNGAWNITVPQANDSNTVSRGIEQPFTNNWVWVDATKLSDGQTNFSSRAPPYTIGPGTNTVFNTNNALRHIEVSATGSGGDAGGTNSRQGGMLTLTNLALNPNVATNISGAGSVTVTSNNLGGWTISAAAGASFETNQFTTNVAATPVRGGLWFRGTDGLAGNFTNGSRPWSMEYLPSNGVFRIGALAAITNSGTVDSINNVSSYWDLTNTAFGTISFGSNILNQSAFSSVLGGLNNGIVSNAGWSVIAGGSNNVVHTNAIGSSIGGGQENNIRIGATYSTIPGGYQNFIGANVQGGFVSGYGNDLSANLGTVQGYTSGINDPNAVASTVSGGENNNITDDYSTIGGGQLNIIYGPTSGSHGTIGGGQANVIGTAVSFGTVAGTIAGGSQNVVGNNSDYAFVGGGRVNNLSANNVGSFIVGGLSNTIAASSPGAWIVGTAFNLANGATNSGVIGHWITNAIPYSIELGVFNTNKVRIDQTNMTLAGNLRLYATTNIAPYTIVTNDFVLDTYYTNQPQRSWVAAVIGMTNILASDKAQVSLYLDQDADGTFERTGIACRMQGIISLSGAEEISAFLQPNARFVFTNLTTGTASSVIEPNSSQWVRQ